MNLSDVRAKARRLLCPCNPGINAGVDKGPNYAESCNKLRLNLSDENDCRSSGINEGVENGTMVNNVWIISRIQRLKHC
jgi:hypothetical protein